MRGGGRHRNPRARIFGVRGRVSVRPFSRTLICLRHRSFLGPKGVPIRNLIASRQDELPLRIDVAFDDAGVAGRADHVDVDPLGMLVIDLENVRPFLVESDGIAGDRPAVELAGENLRLQMRARERALVCERNRHLQKLGLGIDGGSYTLSPWSRSAWALETAELIADLDHDVGDLPVPLKAPGQRIFGFHDAIGRNVVRYGAPCRVFDLHQRQALDLGGTSKTNTRTRIIGHHPPSRS
jgi:hypothetical protein